MDWRTFFSKIIGNLAWPGVVLALLWWLRPHFGGLAKRLEELRLPGGARAKFGKELQELQSQGPAIVRETDALPPEERRISSTEQEEQLDDTIKGILQQATIDPKLALITLWAELEKQARQALGTRGLLRERSIVSVSDALSELHQYGFPPTLSGSLKLFYDVRNKIVHGSDATDDDALRALDSGLTILRALNALPNEINVVYHPGVQMFLDSNCTNPLSDAKGVILKTTSPGGAMTTFRIFPTTRTHFRKDKRVAWEWNMANVWPAAWYRDPDTGEIKEGWGSAAEFVGRHLDDV